jgi:CheY-like chemotaxis protein
MDIQMPVMDGFEVRRIRRGRATARRAPDLHRLRQRLQEHVDQGAAGVDGHLAKPVSVPQLLATEAARGRGMAA